MGSGAPVATGTRPVRCLLFGLGAAGEAVARRLAGTGARVAGAYSRTRHVGRDLGEAVPGLPPGVRVRPVDGFRAEPGMADIALFCTTGRPEHLLGEARDCLLAGLDVLTIAEGAFYPWSSRPEPAAELHRAALEGRATLVASGFQDGIMCHLAAAATCIVPGASRIEFHAENDFAPLGPGSVGRMRIGAAPEDFARAPLAPAPPLGTPPLSTTAQVVEALAALLDLGEVRLAYGLEPVTAEEAVWSPLHGRMVPAGRVAGFAETVLGTTVGGVEIMGRLTARLFGPGEAESFICRIDGPTPLELRLAPARGLDGTAATVVNRIPDVLAAPPGYLTVDRLPAPRLRPPSAFLVGRSAAAAGAPTGS